MFLLHGNPRQQDDWCTLAPLLSPHDEIIAFDFPGFGRNPSPPLADTQLSLDAMADLVVRLAETTAALCPIHLIGHSHGGGVTK
jgi:pimeloyl-ACP methyl ester carboxylesterase